MDIFQKSVVSLFTLDEKQNKVFENFLETLDDKKVSTYLQSSQKGKIKWIQDNL
jgi:hypothetical protein